MAFTYPRNSSWFTSVNSLGLLISCWLLLAHNGVLASCPSCSCRPVESADIAYKYYSIASEYLTNVDDISVLADDPDEWYDSHIEPFESNGIKWEVIAGPRVVKVDGAEEARVLWESFAERFFAFHQWSHFSSCTEPNDDVRVKLRYHGTVRETESANVQDVFGSVEVVFKTEGDRADLITEVIVHRSATLERPYR
eukprot:jgi/Psemu1/289444/fgenesh1_pg.355_\